MQIKKSPEDKAVYPFFFCTVSAKNMKTVTGSVDLTRIKSTSCTPCKSLRDYSSFDIMLVHLKLQTCFVLPGLTSAIRSFQKFHKKYRNC